MEKTGLPALNPSLRPPFMLNVHASAVGLAFNVASMPQRSCRTPCKLPRQVVPPDESEVSN